MCIVQVESEWLSECLSEHTHYHKWNKGLNVNKNLLARGIGDNDHWRGLYYQHLTYSYYTVYLQWKSDADSQNARVDAHTDYQQNLEAVRGVFFLYYYKQNSLTLTNTLPTIKAEP